MFGIKLSNLTDTFLRSRFDVMLQFPNINAIAILGFCTRLD
jgi:hypothetical protein